MDDRWRNSDDFSDDANLSDDEVRESNRQRKQTNELQDDYGVVHDQSYEEADIEEELDLGSSSDDENDTCTETEGTKEEPQIKKETTIADDQEETAADDSVFEKNPPETDISDYGIVGRSRNSTSQQFLHDLKTLVIWDATVVAPNPLQSLRSVLLPSLLSRLERMPLWKIAVSRGSDAHVLALVTQNGELETRLADCVSGQINLIGRSKVLQDPNPCWTHLEWTRSRQLLLLCRSAPVIDVFDNAAQFCYSIPLEGDMYADFDPFLSVSAVDSSVHDSETKWADELWVLQRNGTLRRFLVGKLSGFYPVSTVDLASMLAGGGTVIGGRSLFGSMCVCPTRRLLIVASESPRSAGSGDDDAISGVQLGVSVWRLVDDEPYLLPLPGTLAAASKKASKSSLHDSFSRYLGWLPYFSKQKNLNGINALRSIFVPRLATKFMPKVFHVIFMFLVMDMCANCAETRVVCLTSVGDVGVYELPSLRRICFIPSPRGGLDSSQKSGLDDGLPMNVQWWTDTDVALSMSNGRLYLREAANSLASFYEDQLEDDESAAKFAPCHQLTTADQGLLFVLDCQLVHEEPILDDSGKVEKLKTKEDITAVTPKTTGGVSDGSKFWLLLRIIAVTIYGWLKLALGAAVGRPTHEPPHGDRLIELLKLQPIYKRFLLEVSVPSPEDVNSKRVLFSIHQLRRTTPDEMFRKKLLECDYGEALALASAYDLNTDPVYKQQWLASPISVNSVDNYLKKITNVEWSLHECLTKVALSVDSCRSLAEYGLQLTDVKGLQPDRLTPSERKRCVRRLTLLRYLEALNDYQATLREQKSLNDGNAFDFDPSEYARLRSMSLLENAIYFAQTANYAALKCVFLRHQNHLMSHWLPILSQIPETEIPSDYAFLFPHVRNGSVSFMNGGANRRRVGSGVVDAIFLGAFAQRFAHEIDEFRNSTTLYEMEPQLRRFCTNGSAPDFDLSFEWFVERALEIERRTALPDLLVAFLQSAIYKGFTQLSLQLEEAKVFADYVFSCGDTLRSLLQFREANIRNVAKRLMEPVSSEQFVHAVERTLVPFLLFCESRGRCVAREELAEILVAHCQHSLNAPITLLSGWYLKHNHGDARVGMDFLTALSMNDAFVVSLVDRCISECELSGDRLLIPAAKLLSVVSDATHRRTDTRETESTVAGLNACLEILEIVSMYGLRSTVSDVKAALDTAEGAERLLNALINTANLSQWQLSNWESLFESVLTLLEHGLDTVVSATRAKELFVAAMLRSAHLSTLQMVSHFAHTDAEFVEEIGANDEEEKLDVERTVALVVQAAAQYTNGATGATDPILDCSRICLSLLGNHALTRTDVQAEWNFLKALPLLEELAVVELPVKIRMVEDRTQLIERCLNTKAHNYQQCRRLVQLGYHLELPKGAVVTRCAEEAIRQGDAKRAAEYCVEIKRLDYRPGYGACRDVALGNILSDDVDTKLQLLSYAMCHCPSNELPSLLCVARHLKMDAIAKQFSIRRDDVQQRFVEQMEKTAANLSDWYTNKAQSSLPSEEQEEGVQVCTMYQNGADSSNLPLSSSPETDELQKRCGILLRLLLLHRGTDTETETITAIHVHARLCSVLMKEAIRSGDAHWAVHLAICPLLTLLTESADNFERKLLNGIVDDSHPHLLKTLLYCCCVLACRKVNWELVVKVPPPTLVAVTLENIDCVDRGPLQELIQQISRRLQSQRDKAHIADISQDVDTERFLGEAEYKTETILGMAMTSDEEEWTKVVKLAEEHKVDLWEVYATNLEHLLTDTSISAADSLRAVKRRRLVERLRVSPEKLKRRLDTYALPLIHGADHTRLLNYWLVLDKGCGGSERARVYRELLKYLSKVTPGLDFKALIDKESDLSLVLSPHLTEGNWMTVAKLAEKLPGKRISRQMVQSLWLKKFFEQRLNEDGYLTAFNGLCSDEYLGGLDAVNFEKFAQFAWELGCERLTPPERNHLHALLCDYAATHTQRFPPELMEKISGWNRQKPKPKLRPKQEEDHNEPEDVAAGRVSDVNEMKGELAETSTISLSSEPSSPLDFDLITGAGLKQRRKKQQNTQQ